MEARCLSVGIILQHSLSVSLSVSQGFTCENPKKYDPHRKLITGIRVDLYINVLHVLLQEDRSAEYGGRATEHSREQVSGQLAL